MFRADNNLFEKEVLAAMHGASYKLEYLTNDRINAMGGSHGSLNIATLSAMDVCVEAVLNHADINLRFQNSKKIELDKVIKEILECTDHYYVDKANAALITAVVLYFAGTDTRAGVPAGNRKLGAMSRIIAGVPRGGVATIPSPKLGNKVSGFAAVNAIYEELSKGKLTRVNGRDVPFGAIGTLYMHSVLGEDIVIPEIIEKGTKAAVNATTKAMNGVAMMMCDGMADKISAALLSAAAMLEIVHPDANTLYEGDYIASSHAIGKIAVKELGLPEKLHMIFSNKEYDTGEIVGDIGLLLKDSGNISVICMMGLADLFAMFKEWLVWTGGPTITPIASLGGEAWAAMHLLIEEDGDIDKVAAMLADVRKDWFDPEISRIALNIIATKALEYSDGPVSNVLTLATESTKLWALNSRANIAYAMFQEEREIEDIVLEFEKIRKQTVEKSVAKFCSNYFKREITVEVMRVEPLGRVAKKGEGIGKYWSLDPDVDVKVTIDAKEYMLDRLCEKWIPQIALNQYEDEDYRIAVETASIFIQDLSYSGVLLFNVTVPVCMGVALDKGSINDLCTKATDAAYITGGIPGTKLKAKKAAKITKRLLAD